MTQPAQQSVKLLKISEVKTERDRTDGKVSRNYYTASFQDASNPFAKPAKRNFWQQHTPDGTAAEWQGADPAVIKSFVGKLIPGQVVTRNVEGYEIGEGADQRVATTYTTAILGGELESVIFKSLGHPLAVVETITPEANPNVAAQTTIGQAAEAANAGF